MVLDYNQESNYVLRNAEKMGEKETHSDETNHFTHSRLLNESTTKKHTEKWTQKDQSLALLNSGAQKKIVLNAK